MIRINLAREGRAAVRGAAPSGGGSSVGAPSNLNNALVVGLALIAIVLAGGYWFIKYRELKNKEEQVAERTAEAQKLEAIIKEVEAFERRKDSLEKRIALINDLKRKQRGPVRIMDRISQDLPDLVWLDKMTLSGTRITVEGRALNPNAAANFVENVKADTLFDEPEFSGLSQERAGRGAIVYKFNMSFNFSYPTEEQPAGEGSGQPADEDAAAAGSAGVTGS